MPDIGNQIFDRLLEEQRRAQALKTEALENKRVADAKLLVVQPGVPSQLALSGRTQR